MVGAAPSFSDVHLLRAVITLGKKPIGRKNLVKVLGVGEGSVRTILKRLDEGGLIISSKQGHSLSVKGSAYLKSRLINFTVPSEIEIDWLEGTKSYVVVHNAANEIGSGVNERDIALKSGADGAVILTYKDDQLIFPADISLTDYDDMGTNIDGLKDNDVVVISFGKTQTSAENGALAVALQLCE